MLVHPTSINAENIMLGMYSDSITKRRTGTSIKMERTLCLGHEERMVLIVKFVLGEKNVPDLESTDECTTF